MRKQAVLDAETAVRAQLGVAQEALKAAQDARSGAQGLTNAPNYPVFLPNIDGQISRAVAYVDEIADLLRENAVLAGHVAAVKVQNGNRTPGEISQAMRT